MAQKPDFNNLNNEMVRAGFIEGVLPEALLGEDLAELEETDNCTLAESVAAAHIYAENVMHVNELDVNNNFNMPQQNHVQVQCVYPNHGEPRPRSRGFKAFQTRGRSLSRENILNSWPCLPQPLCNKAECIKCGCWRNNSRIQCPAYGRHCNICFKKNHFAKMCWEREIKKEDEQEQILAATLAVASADVSHLTGYQYKSPLKSFNSGAYYKSNSFSGLSGYPFDYSGQYVSSTPSPFVSSFDDKYNPYSFGSKYYGSVAPSFSSLYSGNYFPTSTVAPVVSEIDSSNVISSTTPAPIVAETVDTDKFIASSTPAPAIADNTYNFFASSTPAPAPAFVDNNNFFLSSTPASAIVDNTNFFSSSTPAPFFNDNSNLFAASAPAAPIVDNTNLFPFSTPAPLLVDNSNLLSGAVAPTIAPVFSSSSAPLYNYGEVSSTFAPLVETKFDSKFYQVQQPTEIYKHFYVHSAPEEPEVPKPKTPIVLPPAQKHYNVIFVKTPNVSSRTSAIVPVQPQKEEKTIVYVLTKKPEEHSEVIVPKAEEKPLSKPEVFFVKYENKQDSDSVIKNIVDEYNNKPGQSVSFSSGVAPTIAPIAPTFESLVPSTLAPLESSSFAAPIVGSSYVAPTFSPTFSPFSFPTYSTPYFAPTFAPTTVKPFSGFSGFSSFPGYSSSLYTFPKRNGFSFGTSETLNSGSSSGTSASSIFPSVPAASGSSSTGSESLSGSIRSGSASIFSDSNAAGSSSNGATFTSGSSPSTFGSQSASEIASEPVVNIGGQQTYTVGESASANTEAKEESSSAVETASENEPSSVESAIASDDEPKVSSNEGVPHETYGTPKVSSDDE